MIKISSVDAFQLGFSTSFAMLSTFLAFFTFLMIYTRIKKTKIGKVFANPLLLFALSFLAIGLNSTLTFWREFLGVILQPEPYIRTLGQGVAYLLLASGCLMLYRNIEQAGFFRKK